MGLRGRGCGLRSWRSNLAFPPSSDSDSESETQKIRKSETDGTRKKNGGQTGVRLSGFFYDPADVGLTDGDGLCQRLGGLWMEKKELDNKG